MTDKYEEQRCALLSNANCSEAVHDQRNVVDDGTERLGSRTQPILDLTPEGRIHSWETLIGVYGFDPVIDLFKLGLDRSEPRLLADHIDELLDIVEAIALQIEDEDTAWEEDESKTDEPDEAALAPGAVSRLVRAQRVLDQRAGGERQRPR
jgi:hypothetical protein